MKKIFKLFAQKNSSIKQEDSSISNSSRPDIDQVLFKTVNFSEVKNNISTKKEKSAIDTCGSTFIFGGGVLISFIFLALIWSAFAPIASFVVAQGIVIPETKKKVVKHMTGGVISRVMVRDGQIVSEGDVLVTFDDSNLRAELAIVEDSLAANQAALSRAYAIMKGEKNLDFESANRGDKKTFEDAQLMLFESYIKTQEGKKKIQKQRIEELREALQGTIAVKNAAEQRLELERTDLESKRKLHAKSYISRPDLNVAESRVLDLDGQVSQYKAKILETQSKIAENEMNLMDMENDESVAIAKEIETLLERKASMEQKFLVAKNNFDKSIITAPVSGSVIHVGGYGAGSVIQPGETLLEILPNGDKLIIEVEVQVSDIERLLEAFADKSNYITYNEGSGLPVKVRFLAYNARLNAPLQGFLSNIDPDITKDSKGYNFYKAKVVIPEKESNKLIGASLYPGMVVQVYVKTGSHSFLTYLLNPVIATFENAFNER